MKIDLTPLNLSEEQNEQILGIIEDKINPEFYKTVRDWIRECYNKPRELELKMCAINEIMNGYGIEDVQGAWQNGYWCSILADYVNMGDTYIPTIIYHRDKGWLIMSWGDLVEQIEKEQNEIEKN